MGGIQGWGSRTRYDEGIKGQGTRLEGTRPPYFTFSSDDTDGDSSEEIVNSGTIKWKYDRVC